MNLDITSTYRIDLEADNFTLYATKSKNVTAVFYEYLSLIYKNESLGKNGLTAIIKNYKPEARSKARIEYEEDNRLICFYTPEKYIFPVFYINFKDNE